MKIIIRFMKEQKISLDTVHMEQLDILQRPKDQVLNDSFLTLNGKESLYLTFIFIPSTFT